MVTNIKVMAKILKPDKENKEGPDILDINSSKTISHTNSCFRDDDHL